MRKRITPCDTSWFGAVSCAAMILFACTGNVAAQSPSQGVRPPSGGVVRSGSPACSAQDKVAVTNLTVNNDRPLVGQSVTARLTFVNKCEQGTADLNVPWEIKVIKGSTSTRVGSGTVTLAPGTSREVPATLQNIEAGTKAFFGSVNLTDGGNNNTSNDVAVTVMKEISLTHNTVQGTGAQFANNVEQSLPGLPAPNCSRLGEFSADDNSLPLNGRTGVVFAAHCQNTGGKANPEAFKNLTLKNGWTVLSATEEETSISDKSNAGFNRMTLPAPNSTSLLTKFHVFANRNSFVYVRVLIVIRGPADKDPFQ